MELKEETARALAERAAVLVEERTRRPYLEIRLEDADVPAGISKIGGAAMLAGIAAGTTGVVLLCVGNHRLRNLAASCDAAGLPPVTPAAELTFGPTPSGVGLALRF